jgi:4-hydroxy-tetrahydrodipicolinate synthase
MVDEGGLPTVLYHIPGRSVISIDVETAARTARAGGVLAIKEAGGTARVTDLRRAGVAVLSGDDAATLPMMALGAVGVISVASNVVPRPVGALVRLCLEGRFAPALAVHERLSDLFHALFLEPNPVPAKAAMVIAGLLKEATVRLPLVEASEGVKRALERALQPFAVATPP